MVDKAIFCAGFAENVSIVIECTSFVIVVICDIFKLQAVVADVYSVVRVYFVQAVEKVDRRRSVSDVMNVKCVVETNVSRKHRIVWKQ